MLSEAKHLGFISSALIQERSEILRSAQNDIGRYVVVFVKLI